MYFNADRKTKESLLNHYKNEREEHIKRKQEDRFRQIQEERQFLNNIRNMNEEEYKKKRNDKIVKINQAMNEYHKNFDKKERRNFTKHHDVNINNIGYEVDKKERNNNYRIYNNSVK
jgi:hypothetical protein